MASVRLFRVTLAVAFFPGRSEEHTSELQSQSNLVCRPLLEKKKQPNIRPPPTYQQFASHSNLFLRPYAAQDRACLRVTSKSTRQSSAWYLHSEATPTLCGDT